MRTKLAITLCALALPFALLVADADADIKSAKLKKEMAMGAAILHCKTVVLVDPNGRRSVAQFGCLRKDGWGSFYYTRSGFRPVKGSYRTSGHELCYELTKHRTHSSQGLQCGHIEYDQSHKRWKYTD